MNIKTKIQFSPVDEKERKEINLKSGDKARVWIKIREKDKTRLQAFEGIVIAVKHGTEPGATFTVRAVYDGIGVERVFPLFSPAIEKIEILSHLKTRRAKLYYIRGKAAKEIRKRMKTVVKVNSLAKTGERGDKDGASADLDYNLEKKENIAEKSEK